MTQPSWGQAQLQSILDDINTEVTTLHNDIQDLQRALLNSRSLTSPPSRLQSLLEQQAFYEAALRHVQTNLSTIDPLPSRLQPLYTRQKLEDLIMQHKRSISDIKDEKQILIAEITKQETFLRETSMIRDGLRARLEMLQVEQQQRLVGDGSRLLDEAKTELEQMENSVTLLMGRLIDFIDDVADTGVFLRIPGEEQKMAGPLDAHIRKIGSSEASQVAKEMKEILEILMNKSITTPTNAYVDITNLSSNEQFLYGQTLTHYLQRANIVMEHPKDARLVKLYEFWKDIPSV